MEVVVRLSSGPHSSETVGPVVVSVAQILVLPVNYSLVCDKDVPMVESWEYILTVALTVPAHGDEPGLGITLIARTSQWTEKQQNGRILCSLTVKGVHLFLNNGAVEPQCSLKSDKNPPWLVGVK